MTDLTKVKTTDDGADIYVNGDGQFLAVVGECTCGGNSSGIRASHYGYCKAKTISRKAMSDVLRELAKAAATAAVAPIEVIDVDATAGPRLVKIIGAERDRAGLTRYRRAAGDLMYGHSPLYVYSDADMARLQEAFTVLRAAREAWAEALKSLTRLDRDKFLELRRAAAAPQEEVPSDAS